MNTRIVVNHHVTSANQFLLLSDACDSCLYVEHAFSLLTLSYTKIDITQYIKSPSNCPTVCLCDNIYQDSQVRNVLDGAVGQRAIVVSPQALPGEAISGSLTLKVPFTLFEFYEALYSYSTGNDEINATSQELRTLGGNSPVIMRLKHMIAQVAPFDTNVLIQGESGVGKDVVANCIHRLSKRKTKPFIALNCGAVPGELIESELFGHEKGAFTGATVRRQGRFELAAQGSLFLDEIGDMPLTMQVKMLRVIQEKQIERVGSAVPIPVDTRLIAATNKNLEAEIDASRFRQDLYYRLNVFPIYVPSLREHPEDLPILIEDHLQKIEIRLQKTIAIPPESMEMLLAYQWPGNIRELANFLERMVVMYPGKVITPKLLEAKYLINKEQAASPEVSDLVGA